MPLINKGEWLTCEDGHRICRAVVDIDASSHLRIADFADWQDVTPMSGETVRPCRCGSLYIKPTAAGLNGHVEGRGWFRPQSKAAEVDWSVFYPPPRKDRSA